MRAYVRNRASPASQRSELSGMRLREYDAPSRVAEGVSGVVVFDANLVDARRRLNHAWRSCSVKFWLKILIRISSSYPLCFVRRPGEDRMVLDGTGLAVMS